ncbi:MAG: hypothetical protein JO358_19595, partial [Alphaproteobacteria bacterium]|nr:hypothetical protein [Alphaproteobacteria bacterium]
MPRASAKSLEPFTIEVSASELPARILETFPKPSPPEARFAVTVEPAESEAEKLAALQRDLQAGLEDLAAGRVSDGEEVFTRLRHVSKTMIDGPGAVYG